jgi:ABC-type transport system involved in multi-copper enzyme maturation permease subunit
VTAVITLALVTLRRLFRGRAVWVSLLVAAAPIAFAVTVERRVGDGPGSWVFGAGEATFTVELFVLAILPALFIAASIGEEIEDRTTTYLWSRPVARWHVLAGKLVALAPLAIALVVVSWVVAIELGLHMLPPVRSMVGLGAGALAISLVATGIATLVPKHGMALSIIYLLFFDLPIGEIPASLQILSVTHQTKLLAGFRYGETAVAAPSITMAVIGGVWLAIGLWRIRRLES